MTKHHARQPSQRALRVGEVVRHALADILTRGHIHSDLLAKTPLTVTSVDVSPDLKNAVAFIMPLGGAHAPEVEAELNRLAKPIRGELGHAIELKFTPALKFRLDTSFDKGDRIDALLREPRVAKDLEADPGAESGDKKESRG